MVQYTVRRYMSGIKWQGTDGSFGEFAISTSENIRASAHSQIERAKDNIRRAERMLVIAEAVSLMEQQEQVAVEQRKQESRERRARTREHNKDPFGFRANGFLQEQDDEIKDSTHFYEVIVSNLGNVHNGSNEAEARQVYQDYCKRVDDPSNGGRSRGESVTLCRDHEPIEEQPSAFDRIEALQRLLQ